MVDAVSLSGNSYRAASDALALRSSVPSAESRPAASPLSALALPQPVTTVSTPSDVAEDLGDMSFLYTASGLSAASTVSSSTTLPAAQTTDARVTAERNSTGRLAIDSADLNTLMSSFLTARTPSANPAPSPDVPADTGSEQLVRAARQSVIAQLYSQF